MWTHRILSWLGIVHLRTLLVRIDGNIASGKSTLIKLLSKTIPGMQIVPEPLEHWLSIVDSRKRNILGAYGEDPKKYAALFQVYAFVTRLQGLHEAYNTQILRFHPWFAVWFLIVLHGIWFALHSQPAWALVLLVAYVLATRIGGLALFAPCYKVWLTERSVHSDMNIFAQNAYDQGFMEELEFKIYEDIYNRWVQLFSLKSTPDLTVYLRASPLTCWHRLQKRGRPEEKKLTLEYLRAIHDKHQVWMTGVKDTLLVLDAEKNIPENPEELSRVTRQIQQTMEKLLQNGCMRVACRCQHRVGTI